MKTQFRSNLDALMNRRALDEPRAAALLGVPVFTLKKWIAGTRAPNASAVRLLDVLNVIETFSPAVFDGLLPAPAAPKPAGKRGRPSTTKVD